MKKKTVGVIGCGKWGKNIIRELKKIANVKFVYNSKNSYQNYDKEIDWVFVLTPNITHYKIVKYFIKKKINNKLLSNFEKLIGSDFRLFFFKHSFQKSLKNIFKFKKNFLLYFVLVFPNINCSTKEIYSKIKKTSRPLRSNILGISSKNKFIEFIKSENNDLQTIVEKKHKKIKIILNLIQQQKNCLFSRMTGSGSVCFGAFLNRKSASLGLNAIKKKFPNYWCTLTKSI